MAKLASGTRIYGSAIIDSTLDVGNTTVTGTLTVGGTSINSTFFAGQSNTALTANNADYLDGQHGAYYAANSLLANYALLTGATFSGAVTMNSNLTMGAADHLVLSSTSGVSANGTYGTAGQVLHSNGTAVYWDADAQGVTSVASGNGLTGGAITTTGTLSVLANTGLVANATGLFVNSAYIATVAVNSANNADYLDGQHGAYYAANSLLANYALLTGATFSGGVTMNANLTMGSADHLILSSTSGISANGTYGTAGQMLTSNGTAVYWMSPQLGDITAVTAGSGLTGGGTSGDVTVNIGAGTGITVNADDIAVNASYIATISANNASYLQTKTWEAPGTIGSTTANSGAFTTLTASANVNLDSGTLFVDGTNNRVGIGITTPGADLDIYGGSGNGRISATAAAVNPSITLTADATNGYYPAINFSGVGGNIGSFRAYAGWGMYHNFDTHVFRSKAGTEYARFAANGNVGIGNTAPAYKLHVQGTGLASSDFRSPIFYDSDNTGYYVDPTGTSYVNIVQLADTGAIVFNDRGRDASTVTLPNWLNRSVRWDFVTASSAGSGGSYAGMMTFSPWSGTTASTGDASYQMIFGSTAVNGGGVPQLRIRNGIDTTWNSFYNIHHDGYADMYATSSFRAPIFYDSNNTGFYVDPNGSCNISYLKVNSNMDVEYNSGGTWMGIGIRNNYASASVNASHFIDFKNENGYVKNSVHSHLVTDGSGYLTWSATAPAVSRTADSRTTIGFAYYNQWDFATSAGIKSNIYYDRDNTNFYVDPNSTSQLYYIRTGNVINIGGVLGDATVAGTNFHGIEFHSEGNRDYYIGKPAGAWTQPLHIHFYTGVWYRAHSDYGGHRFYNLNDGGLKFSVADGDNNVRSIANFYAPIMYDYDNTAYYVDPASSSNVNNLTVAGTLTATISGYAALSGANFTGGISTTGDLGVGSEINMTGAATKYFDHNGTLNFRYSDNSSFFTQAFQINSGIYTVASGSSRAPVFYDSDDTGYYTDPASNTRLRNINLGGGSGFDATIHIIGAQGGNGRLTQMSPNTSSTGGLNLISSRNASNADQWWIWGVSAANYWYCNSGTGFNSSTGFTVDGSGNMTAAGNITAYSDLKLKENIEHITSPLEKVLNMRGVFYNLKQDEQKKRRVGVIAQEVIEILPEVVIAHKDPDDQGMSDTTLSVDYGNMAGLFIEAIKEQQEIIEEQSAKINSLEAKLNEILTLLGNH